MLAHKRTSGTFHAPAAFAIFIASVLASIVITGFTLQLLTAQNALLRDAITESDSRALELLANQLEHELLSAVKSPFQSIKNISTDLDTVTRRFNFIAASSPELLQLVVLDRRHGGHMVWPQGDVDSAGLDSLIANHFAVAMDSDNKPPVVFQTVLDRIGETPVLLTLQASDPLETQDIWIITSFDLNRLLAHYAQPLLQDFTASHGGSVYLQPPQDAWNDSELHEPLTMLLPGWVVAHQPDLSRNLPTLQHKRSLIIFVSASAVLTLLLTTFAAWRELQRERELSQLRNRFIANVTHELRTPLALVRVYVETLFMNKIKDASKRDAYFATTLREVDRLSAMISCVLDLERYRQGNFQPQMNSTDLLQSIRTTLDNYTETFVSKGAEITVDLQEDLAKVAHDAGSITQILLNLINNAIEHGGQHQIHITLQQQGRHVILEVSDDGVGLGAADIKRLLKALAHADVAPSARGSGLGLALVNSIVLAHQAQLRIRTPSTGKGLQAEILFPVLEEHA